MSDISKKTSEDIVEETMKEIMEEFQDMEQKEEEKSDVKEEAKDDNQSETVLEAHKEKDSEEESEEKNETTDTKEDIQSTDNTTVVHLDDDDDTEGLTELDRFLEKKRKRKKILIICGSVIGALVLIYLAISLFFVSHFYFFTKINNVHYTGKTVEQVEAHMEQQVKDYELTLKEKNNIEEKITGTAIQLTYKKSEQLTQILKKQHPLLWVTAFWDKPNETATVGVQYDNTTLSNLINGLTCMKPENQTEPVSAYPSFVTDQFQIVEEVLGTKIDQEVFIKKVNEYVSEIRPTLEMEEESCYAKPAFLKDSAEVIAARDAMNKYLTASVTYDVSPNTEVVDKALIATWLSVDANMSVVFSEDAVRTFVDELCNKYNTIGTVRKITAPNGKVAEVSGGDYGWKIDKEAEHAALVANITAGETVTREPQYSRRGASHGENDYGSTYAEVDLSAQHMWFVKDGAVAMESDVVTGNPNKGNGTPQGSFDLTYKTRNATLKGKKRPDGTYEYESPVAFWMPFNGGIGFHDATWQSSFGGRRYTTNGSHGCINMPYSKAQELYGYIAQGMPVICHY
ncbi:MAG: L,D-transpeptidase/peptidoglycan binding protein [Lachnospiraceae bacterium]